MLRTTTTGTQHNTTAEMEILTKLAAGMRCRSARCLSCRSRAFDGTMDIWSNTSYTKILVKSNAIPTASEHF
jgi:hypothetical protein